MKKGIAKAPWALRITEHQDKPAPVMIVKERILPEQREDTEGLVAPRSILRERGLLYGPAQVRCLPVIRTILIRVCDKAGIPFELHRFLQGKRITSFGDAANRWAATGMKVMLAGQPRDPNVAVMLEELRRKY